MNEQQIRDLIRQELKAFSDRQYFSHHLQMADGVNIQLAKGTGTKIGTETTQKLSFFGVTPVVQYATHLNAAAGAAYGANEQGMLNVLRLGLGSYGFFDIT